jgi:phosphoglycolate phosphatase-like HAD superfamily hydrolase
MRAWLFDIDGTLIDSAGAGQAAFLAAIEELFGIRALKGAVPFAGRTDRAIARDLFDVCGLDPDDANWRRFVPSYLTHLERLLVVHNGSVLPGVGRLLEALDGRGDSLLGLLTGNMREGANRKLQRYTLEHHFHFGGFGDEHFDRAEVARSARQAALGFLNNSATISEFVVVGDTPADVQCARAIGATTVAVASGEADRDALVAEAPDILVESLEDWTSLGRLVD